MLSAPSPGARFASVRFVIGALDPFPDADAFQAAARAIGSDHLLLLWGAETPPKPRAEMEALAEALGLAPVVLPRGKLGAHEELADAVAEAILRALAP